MKRTLVLLVLVATLFSFEKPPIRAAYSGLDEFNNNLISLVLLEDRTYVYKESFLDGSELIDLGEWSLRKDILSLESEKKTRRTHLYEKYNKSFKFKGEKFLYKEDGIEYLPENRRAENSYLVTYKLKKITN